MLRHGGWLVGCLAAGCLFAGCTGSGGDYKSANELNQAREAAGKSTDHDHDHDHSAGPHGGSIVELGDEEYHAEVVVDGKTHTLTVYFYGPDAKTSAAIAAAEVTVITEDDKPLTLKAVSQEGDAEGQASKFELAEEEAVEALLKAGFLHGSLQVEIEAKPYRGSIDAHFDGSHHEDHDDGDHKDEEMKDDDAPESATSTEDSTEKPESSDK